MTRFYGTVGYGETIETVPGVWDDVITERSYYGNVIQNTRYISQGDTVLGEMTFQTTISIVEDAYAHDHYVNIKFVEWAGSLWTVTSVQEIRPRLNLMLGGVYNGPRATDGAAKLP